MFLGKELLHDHASHTSDGTTTFDLDFFTEYERNGFVYRAHPKYRGESAYYDWAYINWHLDDGTEQLVIGRILSFFCHPDGELMAIVHSCLLGTDEQHGVFGTYWHLEYQGPQGSQPKLCMVSVECLQDHACMVPYSYNDHFTWLHIWNPSEWPG